jgi:hypothetical protein
MKAEARNGGQHARQDPQASRLGPGVGGGRSPWTVGAGRHSDRQVVRLGSLLLALLGPAIHLGGVGAGGGARAFGWTAAAEGAEAKSDETLSVTFRSGLLTVYCANRSLDEVFKRVEASTGIRVVSQRGSVRTCRRTTIKSQPLEWALERLLTDHALGYVLVLAPNNDIVAVRIFDTGERVQRAPPSPARRIPARVRRWPLYR